MSELRPSLLFSMQRTVNRARARGVEEAGAAVWSGVRSGIRSQGRLKLLVREAGGEVPQRDDLSFRKAIAADGERYAADIGTDSASTFRRRMSPWTDCYVVEDGTRFLHASWVTTSRAWTSEIRGYISPPVGDSYIYESFTRPELRGRGIYPFALFSICAQMAEQGVGRVWVGVEVDNAASIKAIAKAGFHEGFELSFHRAWGRVDIDDITGLLAEQGRTMVARA